MEASPSTPQGKNKVGKGSPSWKFMKDDKGVWVRCGVPKETPGVLDKLIEADGFSELLQDQEKDHILRFLYGRYFASDLEKDERIRKVISFLDENARERITLLLNSTSDLPSPGIVSHVNTSKIWEQNQRTILLYEKQKNAYTIFKGYDFPYITHYQKSKNCYIHAVSTCVSYCLSRTNKETRAISIDSSKFIRHYFSDEELFIRIVLNNGGNSRKFLRRLADAAVGSTCDLTTLKVSTIQTKPTHLTDFLRDNGPGLISCFVTDACFRSCQNQEVESAPNHRSIHQFDVDINSSDVYNWVELKTNNTHWEEATEELSSIMKMVKTKAQQGLKRKGTFDALEFKSDSINTFDVQVAESSSSETPNKTESNNETVSKVGLHAMVMIGYRTEVTDDRTKYWFLVQNTWLTAQVLEVSLEYLVKHLVVRDGKGGITFLTYPIQNNNLLAYCEGIFLESDLYDVGDGGDGFFEDSDGNDDDDDDSKYLEGVTF